MPKEVASLFYKFIMMCMLCSHANNEDNLRLTKTQILKKKKKRAFRTFS